MATANGRIRAGAALAHGRGKRGVAGAGNVTIEVAEIMRALKQKGK